MTGIKDYPIYDAAVNILLQQSKVWTSVSILFDALFADCKCHVSDVSEKHFLECIIIGGVKLQKRLFL